MDSSPWDLVSTLHRPRVVVGEEDDVVRERLAAALRADGYEVIEAEDGFEVLDYVLAYPGGPTEAADVVVASAVMTGYDGLELLVRLRRMEIDVPFVLMNGGTGAPAYDHAERLGADLVVSSPLEVDEVRDAVFSLTRA